MRKCITWLLILAMVLSIAPTGALAAQTRPDQQTAAEAGTQAALALLGAQESKAQPFETEENRPDPDTLVTIIVVLDESELPDSGRPTKAAQTRMLKQQAAVQQEISEQILDGEPVAVEHSYCTLTNAFSTTVTYAQLQEIRKLDSVVSAYQAPGLRAGAQYGHQQ